MYYVTTQNKVLFWGKLSECCQYLGDELPHSDVDIVRREQLTMEQQEWIHRLKKNIHSSAFQ